MKCYGLTWGWHKLPHALPFHTWIHSLTFSVWKVRFWSCLSLALSHLLFDTVLAPKPVTSGLARAPISPLTQPIRYAAGLSYKSVPSPCTLLQTWLGLTDALFLGYIILFWFWENIWFFEKYSWRLYSFLCLTFYYSKWSSKIMKTILIKKLI